MDTKPTARVSLFDRFDDDRKQVEGDNKSMNLNQTGLEHSIQQEIYSLLNTFCLLSFEELEGKERTSLTYGIPDFSSVSPTNVERYRRLAKIIAQSISAFEPRLENVQVNIEPSPESLMQLWIKIKATMTVGAYRVPFYFDIPKGE